MRRERVLLVGSVGLNVWPVVFAAFVIFGAIEHVPWRVLSFPVWGPIAFYVGYRLLLASLIWLLRLLIFVLRPFVR